MPYIYIVVYIQVGIYIISSRVAYLMFGLSESDRGLTALHNFPSLSLELFNTEASNVPAVYIRLSLVMYLRQE